MKHFLKKLLVSSLNAALTKYRVQEKVSQIFWSKVMAWLHKRSKMRPLSWHDWVT